MNYIKCELFKGAGSKRFEKYIFFLMKIIAPGLTTIKVAALF